MKRVFLGLSLAVGLLSSTGCHLLDKQCNSCSGPVGCRPCKMGWQRGGTDHQRFLSHSRHQGHAGGPSGPTSAQVAYPYYTTRGPRDFLASNPPSIGN